MGKLYCVYGLGAALLDIEFNVTENDLATMNIVKGAMTLVDQTRQNNLNKHFAGSLENATRTISGSIANSIIAIAQFGGRTFFSCKVGDDNNGRCYLDALQAAEVNFDIDGSLANGITGTCLVMITPDAERSLNTFLGANELLSEHSIIQNAIQNSDYLYFEAYLVTSESRLAAAIRASEIARQNGVKIALSLSDPEIVNQFRHSLRQILGNGVDLVFCNRCEALSWAQADDLEIAIDKLKEISHTFAITLGAQGALIYDGTEIHTIEPCEVQVVSTSGAGDMFAGAFLYGITKGFDFPTAGKLACVAAAAVVASYGPRLTKLEQQTILARWNRIQNE
ncbi:unnamed protein product [Rotaria socialis]|uniref:Carbohydrate kinase PfkB domain-containing protein n=1 Tax=Rotaria socialis TaxID=392032 RepID=A0A820RBD6_9BILA|nr:unnamed protein product [Rotaria socialis]CAF3395771.1 unnamed protein product [Rotaria socialis]CAF4436104.1 unnamed protein product [Rotaria socialis]CAF4462059.1 unnamed protein product [Rotaria socialis]